MTQGGREGGIELTPEMRKKMSESQRTNFYEGKELPPYVYYVKDTNGEGFRVKTGGKFLRIMSAKMTMEEKFQEAMRLKDSIDSGTLDPSVDRRRTDPNSRDLPKHIRYDPRREGYYVRKPGCPDKSFTSKKLPRKTKLQQAIDYLKTIS